MNQPQVLSLENISKSFVTQNGTVEVIRNTSLSIAKGDFTMVTGPSGSGKSTLLHIAALLDNASSGKIIFGDQDVTDLPLEKIADLRKHKTGIVFQRFCLLPDRNVLENVMFRFRYIDIDEKKAAGLSEKALDHVGLHDIRQRKARLLSAGEMQRTAIARAIALTPDILFADEPTGNLDPDSASSIMDCLKKLNSEGMTIFMVTHNEKMLEYSNRHLICNKGNFTSIK